MSLYYQLSEGPCIDFTSNLMLFQDAIWNDDYITLLKSKLNDVCLQLEDKDGQEWSRHTNKMEESSWILPKVRDTINPELLTRAWLKMRELLSKFNLLLDITIDQSIYGLFLCEAPGAFIASINHWIQEKNVNCKFYWKACTLNPYHESLDFSSAIFDDRLYKETSEHWVLSPDDNTGNIMHCKFMYYLQKTLEKHFDHGLATFVTADGGISCLDEPENQETKLLPLIFTEMILALNSLSPGGFFILKVFSLFHCNSMCLCFYLCQIFHHVNIAKPMTSKSGNCELYLVCIGFKGNNNSIHQQLLHQLTSGDLSCNLQKKCMFSREIIPLKFIINFQQAITLFTHKQKTSIIENLNRYNVESKEFMDALIVRKKRTCRQFFHQNKIKSIHHGKSLTNELQNSLSNFLCHPMQDVRIAYKYFINYLKIFENINFCQGSLKERRLTNSMMNKININYIDSLLCQEIEQIVPIFFNWYSVTRKNIQLHITSGPNLEPMISNSKFTSSYLLNIYRHLNIDKRELQDTAESSSRDVDLDAILSNTLSYMQAQGVTEVHVKLKCENEQINVTSHLKQVINDTLSRENVISTGNKIKNIKSTLHLYHVIDKLSTEDDFVPLSLDKFFILLEWIDNCLYVFSEHDVLGISVDHSLDRLTVTLMYILSMLFSSFTILPLSHKWLNLRQSSCGHMYLFRLRNESCDQGNDRECQISDQVFYNEFNSSHLHEIKSQFINLKRKLGHCREKIVSDFTFLSLYPIPSILKDDSFYPLVYCINGFTVIYKMRHLRRLH